MGDNNENFEIGLVIPCYRGARYLAAALAGVQAQTHPTWRLVVVDDGSPDNSADIAASFAVSDERIRLVRIPNSGVCVARNTGFSHLPDSVRYVMFLDQDDVLDPAALRILAGVLEAHPQAGLVHCEPQLIDGAGLLIPGRRWMPRWVGGNGWARELAPTADDVTPLESIYCAAGVLPSLSLYRRSVLAASGLYDVVLGQGYEDVNLNIEVGLRSEVRHVAATLVNYRLHPDQVSKDMTLLASQEIRLYHKWTTRTDLLPEHAARIAAAERFRTGSLAVRLALIAGKRALRERRIEDAFRAGGALLAAVGRFVR